MSMFFCCCAEENRSNEEVLRGRNPNKVGITGDFEGDRKQIPYTAPPPQFARDEQTPTVGTPGSRPQPLDKAKERDRLQALVKAFTQHAFQGFEICLLKQQNNSYVKQMVIFQTDKNLTSFSTRPVPGQGGGMELPEEIPLKDLSAIFRGSDVERRIPNLDSQLAISSCAIDTSSNGRKVFYFDETDLSKDECIRTSQNFYTVMKILRMTVDMQNSPTR